MKDYLILSTLILISICTFAQKRYTPIPSEKFTEPWRWHYLDKVHGKQVKTLVKDDNGAIWFIGKMEILKYDGYEWKEYPISQIGQKPSYLHSHNTKEYIYIGGFKNMLRFSKSTKETELVYNFNSLHAHVSNFEQLNDSTLLIATAVGLFYLSGEKSILYRNYGNPKKIDSLSIPTIQIDAFKEFKTPELIKVVARNHKSGYLFFHANNEKVCLEFVVTENPNDPLKFIVNDFNNTQPMYDWGISAVFD
ncbi:MAG: hypothetical protein MI922_26310, partial [Bacteroidales bacterium]|nr:hypothetical protein [Bacteroidales bacterium]